MSNFYLLFSQILLISVPLIIVAQAGLFSEKSGVINIALEGLMVFGAFAGIMTLYFIESKFPVGPQFLFIIALLAGGVASAILSMLHSFASIKLKADQVISGTALNIFAAAFVVFAARILTGSDKVSIATDVMIREVPLLSKIPVLGDMFFKNTYITVYLSWIIVAVTWFVIYKTKHGLRTRAVGEYPQAADSVGISVTKMRWINVTLSGFLAGIGGVAYAMQISRTFGMSVSGYGFLALAVLIFGQWHPIKVVIGAFIFATFGALGSSYKLFDFLVNLKLSDDVYRMLPYVVTLIVLVIFSKKSQAPKALGEAYDKGKR